MARYTWIVLTRCTPGTEAAYARWYDEVHIPDLLRVPGIVAARRGRIASAQTVMAGGALTLTEAAADACPFAAYYSIEADDPRTVLAEVIARADTPAMPLSADMIEARTMLYEDIG